MTIPKVYSRRHILCVGSFVKTGIDTGRQVQVLFMSHLKGILGHTDNCPMPGFK